MEGCSNPIYSPIYLLNGDTLLDHLIKSEIIFTLFSWLFIELSELIKVHILWRSNLNTRGSAILYNRWVTGSLSQTVRFLVFLGRYSNFVVGSQSNSFSLYDSKEINKHSLIFSLYESKVNNKHDLIFSLYEIRMKGEQQTWSDFQFVCLFVLFSFSFSFYN